MKDSLLYNPGSDYRLILDLPKAVKQKVAAIKMELDAAYKGLVVASGEPFIYVAAFPLQQSSEQAVMDALRKVALGFMPFKIHLKNFNHIETEEIFINIEEEQPVLKLVKQIEGALSGIQELRLNASPRVTIAKGLQPFQFVKTWESFSGKTFAATFVMSEMLVLKRLDGYKSWQILDRLSFENMLMRAEG
ncbi:2'-5' RNA ligase family protein [Niabella insulamsoli]|uniref:2'-5' RNA ligase family protein n=1 Tax=Niabella insulamsoli TaxID=3144874 RepID=UPI0031FD3DA9